MRLKESYIVQKLITFDKMNYSYRDVSLLFIKTNPIFRFKRNFMCSFSLKIYLLMAHLLDKYKISIASEKVHVNVVHKTWIMSFMYFRLSVDVYYISRTHSLIYYSRFWLTKHMICYMFMHFMSKCSYIIGACSSIRFTYWWFRLIFNRTQLILHIWMVSRAYQLRITESISHFLPWEQIQRFPLQFTLDYFSYYHSKVEWNFHYVNSFAFFAKMNLFCITQSIFASI